MKKLIVLGAGMVGGVIAKDLAKDSDFEVTVADRDKEALNELEKHGLKTKETDFSKDGAITELVSDYDMVVGALPFFLGPKLLKEVTAAGKSIADITANVRQEDKEMIDKIAKEKDITVAVDLGVAPGMCHILTGYAASLLDEAESCKIMVGGLPQVRYLPYEYKLVFSLLGTLNMLSSPSTVVENGKLVQKPPLADVEYVDFEGLGTLEAFITDGLTSLVHTMDIPNMKEMTLRFPGHVEKIELLKDSGFLSQEPIEIQGVKIKPIDFTAKVLYPIWKMKEGEKDFTVMRVEVSGKKDGKGKKYTYDLLDYYDEETNTTSMARTTGYTCAAMARLMARGEFKYDGLCHAEYIGQNHEVFKKLLKELEKRNVVYREKITEI